MARIRHSDRILYVVSWDESGIIKIGFADHLSRRLRAFRAWHLYEIVSDKEGQPG